MRGVWLTRLVVFVCVAGAVYGFADVAYGASEGVAPDALLGEPDAAGFDGASEESDESVAAPAQEADEAARADEAPTDQAASEGVDLPGLTLTGGTAGLVLLGIAGAAFEFMRVLLLVALVTPLLAKRGRHREDDLTKGRVLGYIEANAGIHFSALRDGLGLANGVTAYHTNNLEREGKIVSWKHGKHRRYASSLLTKQERTTVRQPLTGTRLAVLEVLAENEHLGTTTKELQQRLAISRQLLSHHLRELRSGDLIEPAKAKDKKRWKVSAQGRERLLTSRTLLENA